MTLTYFQGHRDVREVKVTVVFSKFCVWNSDSVDFLLNDNFFYQTHFGLKDQQYYSYRAKHSSWNWNDET